MVKPSPDHPNLKPINQTLLNESSSSRNQSTLPKRLKEVKKESINQIQSYSNRFGKRDEDTTVHVGEFVYNTGFRIGIGSYGRVYEGYYRNNPDKKVAIKVISKKCEMLTPQYTEKTPDQVQE